MSVLKTGDVANERREAINHLVASLEGNQQSHKRIFQTLPKHYRRRAMSYNIKKVPLKMRPVVESDVTAANEAKQKKKPSSKRKKERPHSRGLYTKTDKFWLETHLYHAKRFHMSDLWGWRIPLQPTNKGNRMIIAQTKDNCTLHDISFFSIISITADRESLHNFLLSTIVPKVEKTIGILLFVDLFYRFPLGPAYLILFSETLLWLIVHPLIKNTILSLDLNVTADDKTGKINIFELFGPKSSEKIQKTFFPIDEKDQQIFFSLPEPSSLPPGFSFSFDSYDPRSNFPNIPELVQGSIDQKPISSSQFLSENSIEVMNDAEFKKRRSELLFPSAQPPFGNIPVLMFQIPSYDAYSFGAGWILILPFQTGSFSFRNLVKNGAYAIGIQCSRLINLEKKVFVFPFDRVDTSEGFGEYTRRKIDMIMENKKKPKGKQKDLTSFEITSSNFDKLIFVEIDMIHRGTPSEFASIFFPLDEDYKKIQEKKEIKGEHEVIGLVLNGSNSLVSGKGRGLGVILSSSIVKEDRVVLIKEIGSQFYFGAYAIPHRLNDHIVV